MQGFWFLNNRVHACVLNHISFFFKISSIFFIFIFLNFILFLNFTILYWFCQISKWIHHRYTCVPHPEPSSLLPPHTIPLGCPSAPAPSIQYRASNLDWPLVPYMILYVFQCHSPKSSHPLPLPTPWTVAHQVPLFMRFPSQEYWSGLQGSSWQGSGIKPASPALAGGFFITELPGKPDWQSKEL